MRQVDPVGLDRQFEILSRRIEGPGTTGLGHRQLGLVGAEQHPLQQFAVRCLVVNGEGVEIVTEADRLRSDDAHHLPGFNARNGGIFLDLF